MAAITGTVASQSVLTQKRILILTSTLESASDTITLSLATHGVRTIHFVSAVLEGGVDASLLGGLQVSFSGLVITIASVEQDGTASTNWDNADIRLMVIVD